MEPIKLDFESSSENFSLGKSTTSESTEPVHTSKRKIQTRHKLEM